MRMRHIPLPQYNTVIVHASLPCAVCIFFTGHVLHVGNLHMPCVRMRVVLYVGHIPHYANTTCVGQTQVTFST